MSKAARLAGRRALAARIAESLADLGGGWTVTRYGDGRFWKLDGPHQPPRYYQTKERAETDLARNRETWEVAHRPAPPRRPTEPSE